MGSTSALQSHGRPWTKAGAVAVGAHVFYELAAGAAMPYASLAGPLPVAAIYGAGSYGAFRAAGRRPESEDLAFSVLNGLFLSLVLGHFASWPRTSAAGLPWLTESEGIRGRLMAPYNAILYASAIAAVGGLLENRRGGWWGAVVPPIAVPLLVVEAPREFARLRAQARRCPRWWNRRLQEPQVA